MCRVLVIAAIRDLGPRAVVTALTAALLAFASTRVACRLQGLAPWVGWLFPMTIALALYHPVPSADRPCHDPAPATASGV